MSVAPPRLSRFELQCFRVIAELGEGTVREIRDAIPSPPSYSTVRKIVERLEGKGAVRRVRLRGRAWLYAPAASGDSTVRREIRRFVDAVFGGAAAPLVAHLAAMDAVSVEDLKEAERVLKGSRAPKKR